MSNHDHTDPMYENIIHLPEQVISAYQESDIRLPEGFQPPKNIERVVICGMGGSAITGDLIVGIFGSDFPVEVIKDYRPNYIDNKTLLIAISYSGNTEETLSCVGIARKKGAYIAAITSGGKLQASLLPNDPWVMVPGGKPPRSAIAWLFFSAIRLLEAYGLIESQETVVKSIIAMLIKKAGAIADSVDREHNYAKQMAQEIFGKIPIVYASNPRLLPVAYRWKCQFNENTKLPAFSHTLPEMNHNEIEGWENEEKRKLFIPIFLQNMDEEEQYLKRIRVLQELFTKDSVPSLVFYAEGDTLMERMFSLIYFGDMISFYLAVLYKTDPTAINYINFLKERI